MTSTAHTTASPTPAARRGMVRRALGAAATSVAITVVGVSAIPASAQAAGVVQVGTSPAPVAMATPRLAQTVSPSDPRLTSASTATRRYAVGAGTTLSAL